MATTVLGLFTRTEEANKAVQALMEAGIEEAQISITARQNVANEIGSSSETEGEVAEGVATGAVGGAAFGFFAGLVVASIAVPGIGPLVAGGTLAAVLGASAAGAGVGAAAGGALLGGLAKLGVSEKEAQLFAEGVQQGGILLAVQARDPQVEQVQEILRETGAEEMESLQSRGPEEKPLHADQSAMPSAEQPAIVTTSLKKQEV